MAVLMQTEDGWIVDHYLYLKQIYESLKLCPVTWMFDVRTPYRMQGQAEKIAREMEERQEAAVNSSSPNPGEDSTSSRKYRRKVSKQKIVPQSSFTLDVIYKFSYIMKLAKSSGLFTLIPTIDDVRNNNVSAKNKSSTFLSAYEHKTPGVIYSENLSDANMISKFPGAEILVPPRCCFYNSDIADIGNLIEDVYDLVIIDPPWDNRFIRRVNGYQLTSDDQLKSLPLNKFIKLSSIVVIWITNSDKNYNLLTNELLPKWNLRYISSWAWMKVTKSGAPVSDFHKCKLPYEKLVIARHKDSLLDNIPTDLRVIVSVPSIIHSHKPPLLDVFKPYFSEKPKTLEIFARSLLPDTTSYGNQVTLLQNKDLFS